MTDIVERLRSGYLPTAFDTLALMKEAADEIERLRSLAGAVSEGPTFRETADGRPKSWEEGFAIPKPDPLPWWHPGYGSTGNQEVCSDPMPWTQSVKPE